jgi:hypothetical protein
MGSHVRFASVIGAATLAMMAMAPAMAAAPVSQSGANAANLSVAGNANGSGNVTATNDGSSEKKTGDAAPPISVLKGQSLFNGGVLAQEATARADGTSAACAGLAGNGGSVAQIGDSSCLNPGDPLNATLGSLDLSKLIVADPKSALAPLNQVTDAVLSQISGPINTAVAGVQAQLGNPGLVAGFGAVEGRCTAAPGAADGDATLANAKVILQLPKGAPQSSLTLLNLPVHPKPNTHLTTNLSDVATMILKAVSTDTATSLNGVIDPVAKVVIDQIGSQIVKAIHDNVEKNLAPLEQNLLDITLNRQIRPTNDSIKVRALEMSVLPAAQAQLGAPLVDLQVGNAACGPSGRIAAVAAPAAPPAALPTGVSAGYATMPAQYAEQGHDNSANMIVLGAFAVLVASGAGFATYRRLRG